MGKQAASPHTALAFVIVGLFAVNSVLPYFVTVPAGQGGTLIIGTGKVLETIVVLVLGYYFGSTKESAKKTDALADQASAIAQAAPAAAAAALTPEPGTATITAAPDVDVEIRDAKP